VQTYPCGKDSEENITLHMLSSPNWEFLCLINPRHKILPLRRKTFTSLALLNVLITELEEVL